MTTSIVKKVNLSEFTVREESTNFIKGFVMKRKLTEEEAIYVFETYLGGVSPVIEDSGDFEEFQEARKDLVSDINDWLAGKGEQLGIWNVFNIAQYLIDIKAI